MWQVEGGGQRGEGGGDGIADEIAAPWIGRLTVRGNRRDGRDGDFEAGMDLDGADRRGMSLGSATVAGTLDRGLWDVEADVGTIRAGATAAGWTLDAEGSVNSLDATDALAGSAAAEYFGRISTRGALSAGISATGADDRRGQSIASLSAGSVQDVSLTVLGGIGSITVSQWIDGPDGDTDGGTITAGWLDRLTTRADRRAGTDGDFAAHLTLTGIGAPDRKAVLGTVTIAGSLIEAVWHVAGDVSRLTVRQVADHCQVGATGSIASITAAAAYGSDFLAGVLQKVLDDRDRCADAPGDFEPGSEASIGSIRIGGWRLVVGDPTRFVQDSNFSAPSFGAVRLTNAGGGAAYGLHVLGSETNIRSVQHTDTLNKTDSWTWRPGDTFRIVGSLHLTVV